MANKDAKDVEFLRELYYEYMATTLSIEEDWIIKWKSWQSNLISALTSSKLQLFLKYEDSLY